MTAVGSAPSAWSTDRVDEILSAFLSSGLLGRFELQLAAAALRAEPSASDGGRSGRAAVTNLPLREMATCTSGLASGLVARAG